VKVKCGGVARIDDQEFRNITFKDFGGA